MQVTGSSKTSLRRPRPRCGRSCKVRPVPRPNAGRSGHLWLVARPSRLARCRHADRRAGDLRWRVHGDLRGWPRLRVASVTVGKPDRTDLGPHRDRLDSFRRRMHDHRMLNACRGLAATTSECRRDCGSALDGSEDQSGDDQESGDADDHPADECMSHVSDLSQTQPNRSVWMRLSGTSSSSSACSMASIIGSGPQMKNCHRCDPFGR
mgnify:FL=1